MNSFDAKINTENLTKCLQTLKQFYGDLLKDKVKGFIGNHTFTLLVGCLCPLLSGKKKKEKKRRK